MNSITVPDTMDFEQDVIKALEKHAPQAQMKLLIAQYNNHEELKVAYADLEGVTKQLRDSNNALEDDLEEQGEQLEEMTKKYNNIKSMESTLEVGLAKVLGREAVLSHKEEIHALQLACETSKTLLVTEMFQTVFRPATVRKTIQGSIPVQVGEYQTEYDSEKCRDVTKKTGEHTEFLGTNSTEEETDE